MSYERKTCKCIPLRVPKTKFWFQAEKIGELDPVIRIDLQFKGVLAQKVTSETEVPSNALVTSWNELCDWDIMSRW